MPGKALAIAPASCKRRGECSCGTPRRGVALTLFRHVGFFVSSRAALPVEMRPDTVISPSSASNRRARVAVERREDPNDTSVTRSPS
jgi:hypothetical protein